MLKQFVLKYRTEEDLAEIAALQGPLEAASQRVAELGKAPFYEMTQEHKDNWDRAYKEWTALYRQVNEIYRRAESRYIASFTGTKEEIRAAILEDAREKIDALDEEDHKEMRRQVAQALKLAKDFLTKIHTEKDSAHEEIRQEMEAVKNGPEWINITSFIFRLLVFQREALKVHEVYDDYAAAYIAEQIANKAGAWGSVIDDIEQITEYVRENREDALTDIFGKGVETAIDRKRFQERTEGVQENPAAALPYAKTYIPDKTAFAADAITNDLFRTPIEELAAFDTTMIRPRKRGEKPIKAHTEVTDRLEESERLTSFERKYQQIVLAHINTLYTAGNKWVTPAQIYRAISGDENAKATDKQAELINRVIHAARYMEYSTDLTGVFKAYATEDAKKKVKEWKRSASMLYADEDTVTTSFGKTAKAYRIIEQPRNAQLAEELGQITTEDLYLLNVPINKNPEAIVLIYYLFTRVAAMKHNKDLAREIRYKAVYEELELPKDGGDAAKTKRKRVRDNAKATLDYWTKKAWISGYTEDKSGRELHGLHVILSEDHKKIEPTKRNKKR